MLKEQIRILRREKKISQKDMARHLKMYRSGYARLENASKTISFDQIDTICHVLGVHIVLISNAEYEARNALKSNPSFWIERLRDLVASENTSKPTETSK